MQKLQQIAGFKSTSVGLSTAVKPDTFHETAATLQTCETCTSWAVSGKGMKTPTTELGETFSKTF